MTNIPVILAVIFKISLLSTITAFPPGVPSAEYGVPKESTVTVQEGVNSNGVYTPLSSIGEILNNKISQSVEAKTIQFVTPFPESGRKSPVLELKSQESLPIQADIKYGGLQQFVANLLHPRPIVDTIQEHEKYGNDGGKGRALGTLAVSAFEGLSNVLNAIVDTPFQTAKTVGRKITDSLNQVGGKLVGL